MNIQSFQAAVSMLDSLELRITLSVQKNICCPSPSWDPNGIYRLSDVDGKPQIQKNIDEKWVVIKSFSPPEEVSSDIMDKLHTESRNILFMDVVGWSKLTTDDKISYIEKALPRINQCIVKNNYANTWGDGLVATFSSAFDAATSALEIQKLFSESYERNGFSKNISCRISLHNGEVILVNNCISKNPDILGKAVELAARLEPQTLNGYIFCTKEFSAKLEELDNTGPKAWEWEKIEFAKNYGAFLIFIVTYQNAEDPRPTLNLQKNVKNKIIHKTINNEAISSEADCLILIKKFLRESFKKTAVLEFKYSDVDNELKLKPGMFKKLITTISDYEYEIGDNFIKIEQKAHNVIDIYE